MPDCKYKYVETRDVPLCDFCCAVEAIWRYQAREAILNSVARLPDGSTIEMRESDTSWGACEACAALVERRDVTGLVAHVLGCAKARDPRIEKSPRLQVVTGAMLRSMYVSLFAVIGPRGPAKFDNPADGKLLAQSNNPEWIEDFKKHRDRLG